MIDIEKEKQDLKKHIEEYKEKYKQYLLEILEEHNIKEGTTILYSDKYDSIGVLRIVESSYYSCDSPYEIRFYLITNKGEVSKNSKRTLWNWNIKSEILDYVPIKIDINNKKELIEVVKGIKSGEVIITNYLV